MGLLKTINICKRNVGFVSYRWKLLCIICIGTNVRLKSLKVDAKCLSKFGSGLYLEFLCDSASNR
jgi:hypothetical protein